MCVCVWWGEVVLVINVDVRGSGSASVANLPACVMTPGTTVWGPQVRSWLPQQSMILSP